MWGLFSSSSLSIADDESQIDAADPHLLTAASLLGVDGEQLRHWLANRKIVTARETLTTPLTLAQVRRPSLTVFQETSLRRHAILYSPGDNW